MAGGQALGDAFSKPKTEQFYDDNYLNILEQEILPGYGGTREEQLKAFANEYDDIIPGIEKRGGDETLSAYESLKQRLDNKASIEPGSDLEKRLNPHEYWKDFKGGTMGDMEELAQVSMQGLTRSPEDRALSAKIMEARGAAAKQRDAADRRTGQGNRPGGMGGGASPVEEEVTEAVVEEGATTMPYTGPRTGGAAVNVPLSRRFALDPTQEVAQYKTAPRSTEDIYKYYTQGTEGEGKMLEPYSEFQRRRRKALGRDPIDFWSY